MARATLAVVVAAVAPPAPLPLHCPACLEDYFEVLEEKWAMVVGMELVVMVRAMEFSFAASDPQLTLRAQLAMRVMKR